MALPPLSSQAALFCQWLPSILETCWAHYDLPFLGLSTYYRVCYSLERLDLWLCQLVLLENLHAL